VTAIVRGDVGSVKRATDVEQPRLAVSASLVGVHVIPRPPTTWS
jgi:microcompartment protein CcmL/EutN